ncbi:hypothetical protein RQP46_002029 [Phenoliferia psychrophenolica]
MDPEKQPLTATPEQHANAPRRRTITPRTALGLVVLAAVSTRLIAGSAFSLMDGLGLRHTDVKTHDCTQFDPLVPSADKLLDRNREIIFSEEYRIKSAAIHSGLVQVKSESFDDNGAVSGPDRDPRWDAFFNIESYLLKTFPLLHEKLNLTKVNTHGLVYTWVGSDASLAPSLLQAHQDTVPVPSATLDYWTYRETTPAALGLHRPYTSFSAPWSGHYDGKYVWGRGAGDCKNTLSGILEAVTLLLEGGFVPRRTAIFAFGFDEESKGWEGAGEISKYLEGIYGKDGIAFSLDEGGLGIGEMYGTAMALPSTGEKGYLDVNFTLHTPGGHSSIPPTHTGIGIISSIVTTLESSPYHPSLTIDSPIFSLLQCAAEHGDLPGGLKSSVKRGSIKGKKGDRARQLVADKFAEMVNALPETSFVVVNYRVNIGSSPSDVRDKITERILPLAKKHSLDLDAFGQKFSFKSEVLADGMDFMSQPFSEVSGGELKIMAINELEPAPVSPTSAPQWKLLSSTIKHAYGAKYPDGLVVSPSVMTGNTDTRFMWNLTKHIYRFTPMDRASSFGIHTVDEHLLFDDHIAGKFLY